MNSVRQSNTNNGTRRNMNQALPGFEEYEARKERSRRDQADMSRKGRDIGPLPEVTPENQELVERCRLDLKLFLETFLPAIFYLGWSKDHLRAIATLQDVVLNGGKFALAMPRGNGKTSLVIGAIVWAIVYGHRKFIVAIAATGPKAKEIVESVKTIFETNELLGDCFPAACYPIRRLEGVNNRAGGQLLDGKRTRITWTGSELTFPVVEGAPSSGVIMHAEGIFGSIRGKATIHPETGKNIRPDLALPDDPQTDDSARNPEQCRRRFKIIRKAVNGLAGPGKKIAVVIPCTIIVPNDLAAQVLDRERNPEYRGITSRLMVSLPNKEAMKLWQKYREIRKESLRELETIELATEFYRENREEMRDGAAASWDARFEEEHLDAIQHGMDKWAEDEESFFAEYQNDPKEEEEEGIETLKAPDLLKRHDGSKRYELPEWTQKLTAFVDVQQDVLPFMVVAWGGKDLRGRIVDYGAWPEQPQKYWTLRDVSVTLREATEEPTVEGAIAAGLESLRDELFERYGDRLDWLGVDANWTLHQDVVYEFSKSDSRIFPCHGRYVGATSAPMDAWRKKPGQRKGHFWRCVVENTNVGRIRTIESDGNNWKTTTAKRLKGDPEHGITWWGTKPYDHEMLCDELSAEYAVKVEGRGRTVFEWKNRPGRENHRWDCLVGNAIGASFVGIEVSGQAKAPAKKKRKSLKDRYEEMVARR